MERRMRRILCGVGVLFGVALSFMTCSNPIDIVQTITTEVKSATGKFLVVEKVGPTPNAASVSPGTQIVIVFDRSVDPKTLAAGIVIDPSIEGDYDYDDATRTLTITPTKMDGGESYSVKITKALKGKDASELQDEYVWRFKTTAVPYGTFTIQGSEGSPDGYSLDTPVTLLISPNLQAWQMRFRETLWTDLENNVGWTPKDVSHGFPLSAGEGEKTIYMQFVTQDGLVMSEVVSSTIILDTAPPSVSIGAIGVLCTPALSRTATATATDTNGIGTYGWTKDSGPGTITFGKPGESSTTITASADGNYVAKVTVTDSLGMPGSATLSFKRDTVVDSVSAGGSTKYISIATPNPTLTGSASDSSGAPSYLWTATSGLTIAAPTSASTQVTSASGTDGTNTATLKATDIYGNFKTASVTVIRDTAKPSKPVFNSKSTPSPTLLNEPVWVWDSGGGKAGFKLALLDSGGNRIWADEKAYSGSGALIFPLDTKYLEMLKSKKIYPLIDGTYTLALQEYEPSGNISDVQSREMVVTPVLPPDGATGVVSPVTIQWRAFGADEAYALTLIDPKSNKKIYELKPGVFPSVKLAYPGLKYTWSVQELKSKLVMPPTAPEVPYSFTQLK